MVSPCVLTDARRSVGGGVGSCAPRQVSFFYVRSCGFALKVPHSSSHLRED